MGDPNDRPLEEVSERFRLRKSQWFWAIVGLAIVSVVAVIASGNLQTIYKAQPDFVLGSLLALAGFCFAKTFSKVSTRRTFIAHLHEIGAVEQLALLERNVDASIDRLSEYYHTSAQHRDFYRQLALLRVVLDDLDKLSENVTCMRADMLGQKPGRTKHVIPPKAQLTLRVLHRDVREAVFRRDQLFETLMAEHGDRISRESNDLFAAMTSDLLKADRHLESLLVESVRYPPEEYERLITNYLKAAKERAAEVAESLAAEDIQVPRIFHVMVGDLGKALDALRNVDLPDAREPG